MTMITDYMSVVVSTAGVIAMTFYVVFAIFGNKRMKEIFCKFISHDMQEDFIKKGKHTIYCLKCQRCGKTNRAY